MKKSIIFVNSLFNLIVAIQIRKAMHPKEQFDIIISDASYGLKEIYDARSLEELFDNVYFANINHKYYADNNKGLAGKLKRIYNKTILFISPGTLLEKILGEDLDFDYTDVYFWNPDLVFYPFYMEHNKRCVPLTLHLYSDGIAGYYLDSPDRDHTENFQLFHTVWANQYVKRKYGFDCICNLNYDTYIFSPEFYVGGKNHSLIGIPRIEVSNENIALFDRIFLVEDLPEIKEKYIFFDQPIGQNVAMNAYKEMVRKIIQKVGASNVAVKLHPRSQTDIYKEMGVRVFKNAYPWELYALKYSLSKKVLITLSSSSVLLPDLIFEMISESKIIILRNVIEVIGDEGYKKGVELEKKFYQKFLLERNRTLLPASLEELLCEL